MKLKYILFTVLSIIAVIFFFTIVNRAIAFSSKLIEINKFSEVDKLVVRKAYNERSIYILNDSVFVGQAFIGEIDKDKIQIEDNAIWRPEGFENIPRISDIDAPFEVHKNRNSDTLFVTKNGKTLIFILSD